MAVTSAASSASGVGDLSSLLTSLLGSGGSSLLGTGASLAGAGLAAGNQQSAYNGLQSALNTIGPTQLGGFNFQGAGGATSGFNPQTGTGGIDLGSLNGAYGALGSVGTSGASNYSPQVLQQLLSSAGSTQGQSQDNLNNAYAGNNTFQNAAGLQANTLGQTYNSVYGNTLSSLQAMQQPQVQQQAFGLQNTLFGNGTLNSSGAASGALAAGNFGSQVNAMNAQDALSAQQQALAAQSSQAQNASTLSSTGTNMLNGAFSNFGNTSSLMSSLNTAQLNNSLSALQGASGLNSLGLNNYNAGLNTSAQAASAKNQSLFPYASVAQALAGTQNGQSLLASGLSGLGSSLLGSGANAAGGAASGITSLLQQLFGGGSSSGQLGSLSSAGAPISGSYADTGNFGSAPINQSSLSGADTGAPGTGLDFSSNVDTNNSTDDGGMSAWLAQYGFNGAGGQAATLGAPSLTGIGMQSPGTGLDFSANVGNLNSASAGMSLGQGLGNIAGAYGAINGLTSGTATGQAGGALGLASLANKNGLLGGAANPSLGAGLGAASGALGVYSGLQQGGVSGYAGAASGALRAGSGAANLLGNSGLASGLGSAAGAIAAPLALYNFAKSYQSGNTGGDALAGLQAGATIGTAFGPLGTLFGGAIGGAVGAVASAFGGGKNDPETLAGNSLDAAVAAGNANPTQALSTPQAAFTYLAGTMDAKDNTAGHSQPLEQVFGRMGETSLTNDMFGQINTAVTSGQIPANASAQQIWSSVVSPWLTSKGAGIDPNSVDLNGKNSGNQLITSLQSLIGNWQSGALTSATQIGSSGQADATMPVFAGIGQTMSPAVAAQNSANAFTSKLQSMSPAQLAQYYTSTYGG